jgi:hypothetical protein
MIPIYQGSQNCEIMSFITLQVHNFLYGFSFKSFQGKVFEINFEWQIAHSN